MGLAFAVALGALLMVPFLEIVPGLHGDEAWVGLRVYAIANGEPAAHGMTEYAGPLHQYVLLPVARTLGYRVWVLRSFSVITSLLSTGLLFLVVRRLFDAQLAGLAVLTLASMPWFTLYGRTATENFALNPILALAAGWWLLRATDETDRKRGAFAVACGIALALGTWNHLIFAPVPMTFGLAAFAHSGQTLFRSRTLALVLLGFAVGASPWLLTMLVAPAASREFLADRIGEAFGGLGVRLQEWPALFGALLHGDLLYERYTGEVLLSTPPLAPLLLLASLALIAASVRPGGQAPSAAVIRLCAGFAAFSVLTLMIAPETSDRYLLLVLYLAVVIIALLFRHLLLVSQPLGLGLLVAFVALNAARTTLNFYSAHLHSGGKPATLMLGNALETSNHFVRTDRLYEELVRRDVTGFVSEFFIAIPLQFYDLDRQHFARVELVEVLPETPEAQRECPSFVISYLGGLSRVDPAVFGAREVWRLEQFEVSSRC